MNVGGHKVGGGAPPFIIAEISGNHNQSFERAISIVEQAAKTGVHAIKLQTYTADTITLDIGDGEFFIGDRESIWKDKSLYDLYKSAYTPWEWHKPIMDRANELGLICFSSPFDETAVEFLEELDVPAYKIASFENNHIPLIKKAAETGKPIIISTGMASISEIDEAVMAAKGAGCKELVLLKCTSTYPASPVNSNILTIPHMMQLFDCDVGLSDHTMGIGASIAAVAHGAAVIEKHFTISREDGGVDSVFSLEPNEFESLVTEAERAWQSLGCIHYGRTDSEEKSIAFKRSIYVSQDVEEGEVFTNNNLRIIRPSNGLAPKHYDQCIGKRAARAVKKGTAASWDIFI